MTNAPLPGLALSRNYLRRRDTRQRVMFGAIIECRDVAQRVRVVDFSVSGLRIDGVRSLATGDTVRISLTPELRLEGQVVWVVWHKAGIKLRRPLTEDDPAYRYLAEQAVSIERVRTLALVAVAREHASL